jgi:putative NIF3 family GTP cyclohydrolase 1 type 2
VEQGAAAKLAAADLDLDGPPRAVLADALRPELVHAAVDAGARLYVTGTWRVPAAQAIDETGLTVLLVGHARQERWSLALLAELLAGRLSNVEVVPVYSRT